LIRAAFYDRESKSTQTGGEELIERWQTSTDGVIWIDIDAESRERETPLLQQFGIHRLAIEDAQRDRHPPKIESFDNFIFVLLRGLDADSTMENWKIGAGGNFITYLEV
jgi:magnesium transporter